MDKAAELKAPAEKEERGPLDAEGIADLFLWGTILAVFLAGAGSYWWDARAASPQAIQDAGKVSCVKQGATKMLQGGNPLTNKDLADIEKACKEAEAGRIEEAKAAKVAKSQREALDR